MDTFAESTVITKSDSTGKELNKRIKEICEEVEGNISKTIETSEIYDINKRVSEHPGPHAFIFARTGKVLEIAADMQEITGGVFNPFLGEIIDLWDINNPDENAARKLPEKADFYPAIEKLHNFAYSIEYSGDSPSLISEKPMPKIDLGAIGKGYALDCIADYLCGESMQNALVSFGSSIVALGKNKSGNMWSVGIKDPLDTEKICGYISATDKVISVSGGYERFININGIDYSHIIDPETGYPVDNDLLCVVVVMNAKSISQSEDRRERYKNNGAISDALSTALYVMGKDKAIEFYNKRDYKSDTDLDFDMVLFVKKEDSPKGYEIIPVNVAFNELD